MIRSRSFEQYFFMLLILVFFFWMSLGILKPIILGLFIALVMDPLQPKLEAILPSSLKKGPFRFFFSPTPRSLFLVCLFVALVVLPLIYVGVVVTKDAQTLVGYLATLTRPSSDNTHGTQLQNFIQMGYQKVNQFFPLPFEDFQDTLQKVATAIADFSTSWIASIATSIPRILMELVIFILALYFGLADGRKLGAIVQAILPFERKDVENFVSTTENICRGVVVGSLLSGVIQGIIIGTAYAIVGVPRALFFGVMTAIFSFIPFLGSLPAGLGGCIFLFSQGQTGGAVTLFICWIIASLVDNVVKPMALKGEVEIHPLIAFVSVLGGLSLFGFSGLFLGPVLAALAVVVFEMLGSQRFSESSSS